MRRSHVAREGRLEPQIIRTGTVVVLGTVMSILDMTIVAVALRTLSHDFHVNINTIQWVTTGYLLSLAIVIPVSGWAVHRLGAKPVYMVSLALFVGGSALCALAWSASSLIMFRVIQGLGGGMILPVGQSILARTAGPQRMGRVMGIIGVPQLLGPILGPVLGGVIVSNMSWRWIFLVNVPIGVVALILAGRFLAPSERERDHGFDLLGFLLLSPGLALVVYGLSQIGERGGLTGASVRNSLAAGLVCVALFVWRALHAREPLIDVRLFRDRTFSVASIGIFLIAATLIGTTFLLPLYYQIVRGDSAWFAGAMMAPQGIGAALIMSYAGRISDRAGPRRVVVVGMAGLALGTFFYTSLSATSNYLVLGIALFVRGLGLGCAMMPTFAASYRNLSHADVPKATSATNIIRQIGGSLGVAIFAVVLQSHIDHSFPGNGTQVQAGLVPLSLGDLQKIAGAFSHSFWWSFATCVLGIVPALFLPNRALGPSASTLVPTD